MASPALDPAGAAARRALSSRFPRGQGSIGRIRPAVRRRRAANPGLLLATGTAALLSIFLAGDWIAGLAILVLGVAWRYLRPLEGPPILAMAVTFQWLQATIGIFYFALSGRRLPAMNFPEYRPMVLISLGCLAALIIGLRLGTRLPGTTRPAVGSHERLPLSNRALAILCCGSLALTPITTQMAWLFPGLTQAILAISFAHLIFLFLLVRRLSHPLRWVWIGLILLVEVVFGLTGYFAGFREPLVIAAAALTTAFDRRRVVHWVAVAVLVIVMVGSGVVWMAIKPFYREEFYSRELTESNVARVQRVFELGSAWVRGDLGGLVSGPAPMVLSSCLSGCSGQSAVTGMDVFVDRLWAVYYPSFAIKRVPTLVPYENGAILWSAVEHLIKPRLLFPSKPALASDSDEVRKYSGLWVAGPEQGTSIAFGYVGEAYVDFGIPWMFVPVFVYGLLVGLAYRWLLGAVRHRELAVALTTVVFWLLVYLFERSWVRNLGTALTLMAYLGGPTIVFDRYIMGREAKWERLRRKASLPRVGRAARPRRSPGVVPES